MAPGSARLVSVCTRPLPRITRRLEAACLDVTDLPASGPVRGSAGHTGALSRVQDSEPRPALGLCWLQGLCITFFLR